MCSDDEIAEIIAARDAQWIAWLASAPGRVGEAIQEVQALDAWHDNRPDKPDEM
jgi:hypothetical protein